MNHFVCKCSLCALQTYPKEALVSEDEEVKRPVLPEKVRGMRPAFTSPDPTTLTAKKGAPPTLTGVKWTPTITGANASKLSDGAAACVLTSAKAAQRLGAKPLARIIGMHSSMDIRNCVP